MKKSLYLNKTDLRILSEKLQKFENEIFLGVRTHSLIQPTLTKTRSANILRRFKIQLQAVLLLKNLTQNRLNYGLIKNKRDTGFKQTSNNAKRAVFETKNKLS